MVSKKSKIKIRGFEAYFAYRQRVTQILTEKQLIDLGYGQLIKKHPMLEFIGCWFPSERDFVDKWFLESYGPVKVISIVSDDLDISISEELIYKAQDGSWCRGQPPDRALKKLKQKHL